MEGLVPELLLEPCALDRMEALEVSRHAIDVVGQLLQLARSAGGNAVSEVASGDASQVDTEPADRCGDAIDAPLADPQTECRGQPDHRQDQEQALMVREIVSVEQGNRAVFELV